RAPHGHPRAADARAHPPAPGPARRGVPRRLPVREPARPLRVGRALGPMRWPWLACVLVAAGCAGPAGLRHRVERGETLYRIGKAYGVPWEQLAKVNTLKDP